MHARTALFALAPALFATLVDPRAASAEPSRAAPNAVAADLGLAVLGLGYERLLTPAVAIEVEAQYFSIWWAEPHFRGFGAQLRPTFFPLGEGPRGLYLSPFGRVHRVTAEETSGASVGASVGAFAGWAFVFGDWLDLRVGAGAQYMGYAIGAVEWKKVYPALDLVVGLRF